MPFFLQSPAELDPLGADVGLSSPPEQNNLNSGGGGFGYPYFGDPFGGPACYIDGILQLSCGLAFQMLQMGIGEIGPLNPIAAWQQWQRSDGTRVWRAALWERGTNGRLGYHSYSEGVLVQCQTEYC